MFENVTNDNHKSSGSFNFKFFVFIENSDPLW